MGFPVPLVFFQVPLGISVHGAERTLYLMCAFVWRVRVCGNSHFVSLAADACCRGWCVGNHRKQRKEGKASSLVSGVLSFALPVPQILSSISRWLCWRRQKHRGKERGGGKGLEYVGVFFLFSKCVRACVRAIVCMFSVSKILLKFFPLIYIWVIENCREKRGGW